MPQILLVKNIEMYAKRLNSMILRCGLQREVTLELLPR